MHAFFYGTLMVPKILKRVIGNDGSHLRICPAVLVDYTRHCVKSEDYPGIIPYAQAESQKFFDRELDIDERSVRGILVTGLTSEDISVLDVFEGDEYVRKPVQVHQLSELVPLSAFPGGGTLTNKTELVPAHAPPLPKELGSAMDAETYVWIVPENLEKALWSFDDFVQKNAWKWYGETSGDRPGMSDVDKVLARREKYSSTVVVQG